MKRKCVICGAKVRNHNPKATTCSPTCTMARKHGITREEQIQIETDTPEPHEREWRGVYAYGSKNGEPI